MTFVCTLEGCCFLFIAQLLKSRACSLSPPLRPFLYSVSCRWYFFSIYILCSCKCFMNCSSNRLFIWTFLLLYLLGWPNYFWNDPFISCKRCTYELCTHFITNLGRPPEVSLSCACVSWIWKKWGYTICLSSNFSFSKSWNKF